MNTTVQPEAPTASPAPREQCITLAIEVETMADLETGELALIASTGFRQEDLAQVSPARARGMIAEARARLDEQLRLVNEFEARTTLAAILAEHDLTLVEVDMREVAAFGPDLAPHLQCWSAMEDGRRIVWVPAVQDPIERTDAIAKLVNDLQARP